MLPRLVSDRDLQGVLHVHTTASDGRDSLETMALAAREAGYRYVAFTDHSKSAGYAGGLSEERVLAQREEIRALRRRVSGLRIFHGTEADILADGSIDYGDEFLAHFDLVVASVHSRFGLSAGEQTARLIRAVSNPRVSVLGHPTGRLLLEREGLTADMEAVFEAAAASGCALEINGSPNRLDLGWRQARAAAARGALLAIDPDAHSVRGLGDTAYGRRHGAQGLGGAALGPERARARTSSLPGSRGGAEGPCRSRGTPAPAEARRFMASGFAGIESRPRGDGAADNAKEPTAWPFSPAIPRPTSRCPRRSARRSRSPTTAARRT